MKISVLSPDLGDATSIYRAMGCYKRIPKEFEVEFYAGKAGFFLWDSILNADVVVLQRPYTKQHSTIAQCVKSCGKKLIVDFDDQLDVVPNFNPHYEAFADCKPHLETCVRLADVTTVSTPALQRAVQMWGGERVEVVRNAIDDELVKAMGKKPRQKILAWRGSNTHIADLEIAREPIEKAMANGYEIAFFGFRPPFAYAFKHKYYPVSDYCQYMATLDALAPEYMLVTLVDHPFNHAKSDVAAQECWTIGAKLIHNGIGEYAGLPETQKPRLLSDMNAQRIDILNSLM